MEMQETTIIESPTIKQIRIAFEHTPSKVRAVEQGWRQRRKGDTARKLPITHEHIKRNQDVPLEVRHRARYPPVTGASPKIPTFEKPMITPAATPPIPPISDQIPLVNKTKKKKEAPAPILAYPLAPSLGTIQLGRNGSLTIPQHTTCSPELILDLGGQDIVIGRGGDSLEMNLEDEDEKRSIHRTGYVCWSRKDWRQWEMVRDLVEQVKRKTPRVSHQSVTSYQAEGQIKIYHPSALIAITCSSPPDVVITYTISGNSSDSIPISSEMHSLTAIKLVYSPSREKMVIDTSEKQGMKRNSTFRTRRSVPTPSSHLPNMIAQKPNSSACTALGLNTGPAWSAVEVEAVKRFWALRKEWLRYYVVT